MGSESLKASRLRDKQVYDLERGKSIRLPGIKKVMDQSDTAMT